MIETRLQHRRRPPIILSRPEHDDRVRGPCFVPNGEIPDFPVKIREVDRERDQKDEAESRSPFDHARNHATCLRRRPLKNSSRLSKVTGPSRNSTGGSAVRSSSVEPERAGKRPPSTSAATESPS